VTITAPLEIEDFWDDLLAFIEEGRVIPVVGPSLLRVDDGGRTVPMYSVVARRLLEKYNAADTMLASADGTRHRNELSDAVAILAERGRRPRDLYRPIHDIIESITGQYPESLAVLRELATITQFDLFATTTPDRLLARALNVARFGGGEQTQEIEYAPKLPTERRRDMPTAPSSRYTGVLHLFGRSDVQPFYAIHDEDTLEFAYMLQHGGGPERFFSQMRSRNLLFIGCTFSEWLNRFFIRMSNSERLSYEERSKSEFLVGDEGRDDGGLTVFLERFSRNSRCVPADAVEFVSELVRRWKIRNPVTAPSAEPNARASLAPATPTGAGAVFISYASEDVGAAKALYASLSDIGADVAWYDKSELQPGDDWNEKITGAIQRCGIFVPVLSRNTEQRQEGYFRLEWHEATERLLRMQGRKFIFPVVVDPEFGAMEQYALVPRAFRAYQYTHAPGGQMPEALRDELQAQLREFRRARAS
jgi:hypothetical protein